MRVIVSGGAGFCGSNIVAEIERRGLGQVAVIDTLADDRWLNLSRRKLHSLIAPRDTFEYLRSCPDDSAVIHMGARTSTLDDDVDALVATNARLTADLFSYCGERGWPFVYASSAAVYGQDSRQSDVEAPDFLFDRPPLNPYAWSKLMADVMVAQRAHEAKPPPKWAGLRLFNVYGPNEKHKGAMKSFPSKCFDAIKRGEPIRVFRGSDRFKRDFVYVKDVARLVCDLLASKRPVPGGVYNVGAGQATSFIDVAQKCIEAAGKVAALETAPFPEALHGRYQSFTRADTAKLKKVMPELAFTALEDGLTAYWGCCVKRRKTAVAA